MAAGQLASWQSMAHILGDYRAVPVAALPWLAAALILAELVAGGWLLLRPRSYALAPVWVYTAVALLWTGMGVEAYGRGLAVANCGCFGAYLTQKLTWFTLAQDALLLVYAALMIRAGIRARRVASVGERPARAVWSPSTSISAGSASGAGQRAHGKRTPIGAIATGDARSDARSWPACIVPTHRQPQY